MNGPTYGVVEATVWFGRRGLYSAPPPVAIYLLSHLGCILASRPLGSGSVFRKSRTLPAHCEGFPPATSVV